MAKKKSYPLRIDEDILRAMKIWADDELRSTNAQIEYMLRDSLRRAGRLKSSPNTDDDAGSNDSHSRSK